MPRTRSFIELCNSDSNAALGDWSLILKVIPGLRAVTAEQVQQVVQKYFDRYEPDRRTSWNLTACPFGKSPQGGLGHRGTH